MTFLRSRVSLAMGFWISGTVFPGSTFGGLGDRGGGDRDGGAAVLRALGLGLGLFLGDGDGDLDWVEPVAFCHRSARDWETMPPFSGGLKACFAVVRLSELLGKLPVDPAGMRPVSCGLNQPS